MKYQEFKTVIECLEKVRDRSHSAYQLGLDLMNYDEDFHEAITILLKSVFEEQGYDWISWYLYEKRVINGKALSAYDADGNEICNNILSLWDTVKPYRKQ